MMSVPHSVRFFVAAGAAALLVGCSSGAESSTSADGEPTSPPASTSAAADDDPEQGYLDQVNALCDALLPKVIEATDGGSTDVPATKWVATWPAHKALLDGFDADLAKVPVPPEAADSAKVMSDYVGWATGVDEARIAAARQGEAAWRRELAAESDITSAPELLALAPAGFDDSCQAR